MPSCSQGYCITLVETSSPISQFIPLYPAKHLPRGRYEWVHYKIWPYTLYRWTGACMYSALTCIHWGDYNLHWCTHYYRQLQIAQEHTLSDSYSNAYSHGYHNMIVGVGWQHSCYNLHLDHNGVLCSQYCSWREEETQDEFHTTNTTTKAATTWRHGIPNGPTAWQCVFMESEYHVHTYKH